MNYFYGPVHSRRLGYSLGVNLFSEKTCTFDCIYCQVGKSLKTKIKRVNFQDFPGLKKQLKEALNQKSKIDYITFSGFGEPTLYKNLGEIIETVKKISRNKYPVCVITNSSFLHLQDLRRQLKSAGLVIPSLDAGDESVFQKINHPHSRISLNKIVGGLIDFRREFQGKIWLEVMIIDKVNDSLKNAQKLKSLIKRIRPDKVQINLPVRASAGKVSLPKAERLKKIKNIIGKEAEVVIF